MQNIIDWTGFSFMFLDHWYTVVEKGNKPKTWLVKIVWSNTLQIWPESDLREKYYYLPKHQKKWTDDPNGICMKSANAKNVKQNYEIESDRNADLIADVLLNIYEESYIIEKLFDKTALPREVRQHIQTIRKHADDVLDIIGVEV